jgi:DNA polymerase III epsilon subunit family exonuclease
MPLLPTLAMLLAAFGWAFGNVGNKAALVYFAPLGLVLVRFAAASAFLWLVLIVTGRLRSLRQVQRGQFVLGLIEPFIVSLAMAWGLRHAPASHAVVLWSLMPVVAPLLSRIILGEPLSAAVSIGAALAIAGSVILVVGGEMSGASLFGDGLMILAILIAAGNQLLSRRMAKDGADPVVTSAVQNTVSMTLAGLLLAASAAFVPLDFGGKPVSAWALVIALGVIGGAVPFVCYHYAMRTMSVGRTALFVPLIAPLGTALSGLWLGETLGLNVFAALALTLVGVSLPMAAGWRRERPEPTGPRPEVFDPSAYLAPSAEVAAKPLAEVEYVVFDCETTGLRPSGGDRLVAIGAVKVRNGAVVATERFETLVQPGRRIPATSTRFHGITDAMVADAPATGEALQAFRAFTGDAVLVAHNAAFDLKFLHLGEAESGVRFDRPAIDTLLIAARLEPTEPADLDSALKRRGLAVTQRHGALADAEATAELLVRQLVDLRQRGIATLGELVHVTRMVAELRARSHRF